MRNRILPLFIAIITHLSVWGQSSYPDNMVEVNCASSPTYNSWWDVQLLRSTNNIYNFFTPLVGDIDGDGIVEIVVATSTGAYFGLPSYVAQLAIYRGTDLHQISTISVPQLILTGAVGPMAIVRYPDGGGGMQGAVIVQCNDMKLRSYDINGNLLHTSDVNVPYSGTVSVADFNSDGWPEVYIGSAIYDAATLRRLCAGSSTGNMGLTPRGANGYLMAVMSFAANVLGDAAPELICGNTIYRVTINSRTNASLNSVTSLKTITPPTGAAQDGYVCVADFDLDGNLDVLVVQDPTSIFDYGYVYIYAYSPTSENVLFSFNKYCLGFGMPLVGDFDGDGYPEIVVIDLSAITGLKWTPALGLQTQFTASHTDWTSAMNSMSGFDFNDDGIMEIIYRDESNLRIINASGKSHITGNDTTSHFYNIYSRTMTSGTAYEYPVIADVNNDGAAEIIVCGDMNGTATANVGQLAIFGGVRPWPATRKVWNQYLYNVTNINEDLTAPQQVYNNATAFTDPNNVVRRPLNNFMHQASMVNQYGRTFTALADVVISHSPAPQTVIDGDTVRITVAYSNQGDADIAAPYGITLYKNIYRGERLWSDTLTGSGLVAGLSASHTLAVPRQLICGLAEGDSVVVALNDKGGGIAQHGGQQAECDTTNNTAIIQVSWRNRISDIFVSVPDTFRLQDSTYSASTIDTVHYIAACGCDSAVVLHLTVTGYPDNVFDANCTVPAESNAFEMTELYHTTHDESASMCTPMVADVDGDGLPEIVTYRYYNSPTGWYANQTRSQGLVIYNGQTGAKKYEFSVSRDLTFTAQGICIADIDHDGKAEFFLLTYDRNVLCYSFNAGTNTWTETWCTFSPLDAWHLPLLTDLMGDGNVEVVCGHYVFNATNGVLLLNGSLESDGKGYFPLQSSTLELTSNVFFCAIGDMDGDGRQEVCAGRAIYKPTITNYSGTAGNTWSLLRKADANPNIFSYDGETILLDFDGDGDLDVCVIGTPTPSRPAATARFDTYVWDGQTAQIIARADYTMVTQYGPTVAYCGDLDGNGLPEIVYALDHSGGNATEGGMMAYTYDPSASDNMRLMHRHVPFSETAGFTVFDFNQDGKNEIVYQGIRNLYIADGTTLAPLCTPITSYNGTHREYPIVADVNGDGHAEIILANTQFDAMTDFVQYSESEGAMKYRGAKGCVSVFGSAIPGAWSSARKVWNQWTYSPVYINEDLTVPHHPFNPATAFPNGTQPYNRFLGQVPYITPQGNTFNLAPDAVVTSAAVTSTGEDVTIEIGLSNQGDNALNSPYGISVYKNAYRGELLRTDTVTTGLAAGATTTQTIQLPRDLIYGLDESDNLVIAINDMGSGVGQHGGQQAECDTVNNLLVVTDLPVISRDDHATTLPDSIVTIDPTANDFTPGSETFVTILTPPTNGTASVDSTTISYKPDHGFTGLDSLQIIVGSDTASTYQLADTSWIYIVTVPYPDNIEDVDCTTDITKNPWDAQVLGTVDNIHNYFTPVVGDIDGDGVVEIVVASYSGLLGYGHRTTSVIILKGTDLSIAGTITVPEEIVCGDFGSIALVRYPDGVGGMEGAVILHCFDNKLRSYSINGALLHTSDINTPCHGAVSITDFNGDGWPEVYVGNAVYDAATLRRLCAGPVDGNMGLQWSQIGSAAMASRSFATDVTGDALPELICGNTVYGVNVASRTDVSQNSVVTMSTITIPSHIPQDGGVSVGDFDKDGSIDVLVQREVSGFTTKDSVYFYAYNPVTSQMLFIHSLYCEDVGPALISDIDGDGVSEFVYVNRNDRVCAVKYKQGSGTQVMFEVPHTDRSGMTAMTCFDFNQDGIMEIVYRDETDLRIINASGKSHITGNDTIPFYNLYSFSMTAGTLNEYPVVADVNGDGAAEIVVCGKTETGEGDYYQGQLVVIGGVHPWAPARKVWNQYMYNVTNINEDLTVPRYQFSNATAFTDPSNVVRRPFNNFLQQATTLDQYGRPFTAAADIAVAGTPSLAMDGDTVRITIGISNQGDTELHTPYGISVYKNAYRGELLQTDTITTGSLSVGATTVHSLALPRTMVCGATDGDNLVIALNDMGAGIAQNGEQQAECDTTNNIATLLLTGFQTAETHEYHSMFTGESYLWNGNTYTTSGDYSATGFIAVNGCDSTAWLHLTVTDKPVIQRAESISICPGDSCSFYGQTLKPTTSTVYTHLLNGLTADTLVTLNVNIWPQYDAVRDTAYICDGATYTWEGDTYSTAGNYTKTLQTIHGCDSVVTLTLITWPKYPAVNDTAYICEGSTFLWEGDSYSTAGNYTKTLTTIHGCDSVVTLTLIAWPKFVAVRDTAYICEGSSYTWEGDPYTTAGNYTKTLSSIHGCDSVVTLTLITWPTYPAAKDTAYICDGATYIWEGDSYSAAGNYTKTLQTIHGCDSVVTLHLTVLSKDTTIIPVNLCDGDTHTWEGDTYSTAGDYTKTYTNAHGCDSVVILRLRYSTCVEEHANAPYCEDLAGTNVVLSMTDGQYVNYQWEQQVNGEWQVLSSNNLNQTIQLPTTFTDTLYVRFTGREMYNNLIVNGDFESGNTGFETGYTYMTTNISSNATYAITNDVHTVHSNASCNTDHTTGSGLMMAVNGGSDPNANVWTQTVTGLQPHTDYAFSAWAANWTDYGSSNADLEFSINGVLQGQHFSQTSGTCIWKQLYTIWNSGDTTSAQIRLVDHVTVHVGNDFCVDDIYFSPLTNTLGSYKKYFKIYLTSATSTSFNDTICEGDNYVWDGDSYATSGDYTKTYTATNGCDSVVTLHLTVHPSYMGQGTASHGFTINASGEKIVFAPGNLQYNAAQGSHLCADGTTKPGTWRFAENQWNYVGDWTEGNVYENSIRCDNALISSSYDGWIDLFGWGTSGYNEKNPYMTSTTSADYGDGLNSLDNTYYDWGVYNTIGADAPGTWRTLSYDEWDYLSNTRSNHASLCGHATVNGAQGFVFLPDDWVLPTGLSFVSGTNIGFDANVYTIVQWSLMENNGAVFLPKTGNRSGSGIMNISWKGAYWSTTCDAKYNSVTCASYFMYGEGGATMGDCSNRVSGYGVRLVKSPTNQIGSDTLLISICEGETYVWEGDSYTAAGNYTKTLQTIHGCDSIVTLHLIVNSPAVTHEYQSIFTGESYSWNGNTYATSGDYSTTGLLTANGCDSTAWLHLTVSDKPVIQRAESISICPGDSCAFYGQTLKPTLNTIYTHLLNGLTADTLVTLNVSIWPQYPSIKDTAYICDGASYVWEGDSYSTAGNYTKTLSSIHGCDSVVTLTLITWPTYPAAKDTAYICDGATYIWEGDSYSAAGNYTKLLQTIHGCDSVVTLTLIIWPKYPAVADTAYICEGASYVWEGETYSAAGNYAKTLSSIHGCDSVVTLTLITWPKYPAVADTAYICDGATYIWEGDAYSTAGDYTKTLQTIHGCDSVVTLALVFWSTYPAAKDTAYICEGASYIWEGDSYSTAGNYTKTLSSIHGCDSIVTLHLIVNSPAVTHEYQSIFTGQSYFWNGNTYTTSGDYPTTGLLTANGCDSTAWLHLTVSDKPVIQRAESISICLGDSCSFYGQTLKPTINSVYTHLLNGLTADTLITLNVNIWPQYPSIKDTAYICDGASYVWEGDSYSVAGDYTKTLSTIHGCDSVVTLTLITWPKYPAIADTAYICDGETYIWEGDTYTTAGNYTKTLSTIHSCDSIVTLTLITWPKYPAVADTAYICEGETYVWEGDSYTAAGNYTKTLQTIHCCDSIVTLHLIVNSPAVTHEYQSIFTGQSYFWNGNTYTTSGDYATTGLLTINGCDSTAWLHLTVSDKPVIQRAEGISICSGDSCSFYGQTLKPTINSVYTHLLNGLTADTLVTLNVNIWPKYDAVRDTAYICEGSSYIWEDDAYTTAGNYTKTLQTIHGCDSVVTLTLVVWPKYETVSFYDTICAGDIYTWEGSSYTTTGIYTKTLTSLHGCDSVVTLHLTVWPSFANNKGFTINAQGDKIVFAPGNLQYNAAQGSHLCADGTTKPGTWRFAAHQWDYVGNATFGTVYENDVKCDNALISSTYDGWIDLFGWGTSGWNSGAVAYQPYDTSSISSHYGPGGNTIHNLAGAYAYADWAVYNTIGNDAPGTWRTLTYDEWLYLFEYRPGYQLLRGQAMVNSVPGYVLLPDDWEIPAGLSFQCGTMVGWFNNNFSIEQWAQMEAAGAVFFPAAGNRGGNYIYSLADPNKYLELYATHGVYWSSSQVDTAYQSWNFWYYYTGASLGIGGNSNGYSVRPVRYAATDTLKVSICEGETYTWNDSTYAIAGDYTKTLTTIHGCDSVVTLHLNVWLKYDADRDTAYICDGAAYTWEGDTYSTPGNYAKTLQTIHGCDSIRMLTLITWPTFPAVADTAYVCEGDTYTWEGDTYSTAGNYTKTLSSSHGCDSIRTLTLITWPKYPAVADTAYICEGETYLWEGNTYSTAGNYTKTLQTIHGCDSVVTLTLITWPKYPAVADTAYICEEETYTWEGDTYSAAGNYTKTLQTTHGCDSVVTLTLITWPKYSVVSVSDTICESQSYIWEGDIYSTAGNYTKTLQTIHGCDSVVTLNLSVYVIPRTTINDTIVEGYTYNFNGNTYTTAGDYEFHSTSSCGCDSITILHLTNNHIALNEVIINEQCAGEGELDIDLHMEGVAHQVALRFNPELQDTTLALTSTHLSVPYNARAGQYTCTINLLFRGQVVYTATQPFTLLYPASVLEQAWNDVVAVLTHDYNGGYDFVSFQWYENGNPLVGETHSYLYRNLTMGAEYAAKLTDVTGLELMTCPLVATPQIDISLYPTILHRRQKMRCHVSESSMYMLYDATGRLCEIITLDSGEHIMEAPMTAGVYMAQIKSINNDIERTFKIIVK